MNTRRQRSLLDLRGVFSTEGIFPERKWEAMIHLDHVVGGLAMGSEDCLMRCGPRSSSLTQATLLLSRIPMSSP